MNFSSIVQVTANGTFTMLEAKAKLGGEVRTCAWVHFSLETSTSICPAQSSNRTKWTSACIS